MAHAAFSHRSSRHRPLHFRVFISVLYAIPCFGYTLGFCYCFSPSNLTHGVAEWLMLLLMQVLLIPLYAAFEAYGIVLALIAPWKKFAPMLKKFATEWFGGKKKDKGRPPPKGLSKPPGAPPLDRKDSEGKPVPGSAAARAEAKAALEAKHEEEWREFEARAEAKRTSARKIFIRSRKVNERACRFCY